MNIGFLIQVFECNKEKPALIWKNQTYSYQWLLERIDHWQNTLEANSVKRGSVVTLEADFSPNSVALFLALIERGSILVPLTSAVGAKRSEFIKIAKGEVSIVIDEEDKESLSLLSHKAHHPLYEELRLRDRPGLVLFSSGSTGQSKAAVHDLVDILEKFRVPRAYMRTIPFLLYDHIGGVNTMLYTLSNGGCLVTTSERTPDKVLSTIEKYQVELLPTSPTFMNLILLSEAYKQYDLSSLKIVTYGTEPMPETTLRRFHELFPEVKLLQTYGLSEVGILRSKSKSSDSLWVKVGGEGFQTRVVDGILHIKAQSAMLGYLNAPSPFTEDGWFNTEDAVEVEGEYIKILGRQSEIINVGGEKVYPAEVESVIQEMENVREVTVYGEKNAIMGNIVCAKVTLLNEESPETFKKRLKSYCNERLSGYKIPIRILIAETSQYNDRFKKVRRDLG